MTETAYIDIQFKGKSFSPGLLAEEINLPIETLVSSGELGKVGRFKNKPVPYGIGLLKINPDVETLNSYSDLLLKSKSKLKKYNVEEIIIDVDASSEALENMAISGSVLKKLSSLNARIQFHNNEVRSDDFTLIKKLITKVSTASNLNKLEIEEFLQDAESIMKSTNLTTEYLYAIIVSFIENMKDDKKLSKESLEQKAEEFDQI